MPGTIHGLDAVFRVIELHEIEKVLRVIALVTRGEEKLPPHHMWRVHQRISALDVLAAHPVFHLFADDPAMRMPENQAGAGEFLDGKQIELLAEHSMVALLRFFESV